MTNEEKQRLENGRTLLRDSTAFAWTNYVIGYRREGCGEYGPLFYRRLAACRAQFRAIRDARTMKELETTELM